MAYAQNKSLEEYGDLHSQHHSDVQMDAESRAAQAALEEEPPRLVVYNGPGNLYRIKWTHGDQPLPVMCAGDWNHKGKAQEAIDGSVARLKMDANAQRVLEQAEAAEVEEARQLEMQKEQERLEAEEQAAKPVVAEEAAPAPVKKKAAVRKGK